MLWYNDNENMIAFVYQYTMPELEQHYNYRLEWRRMRDLVDACFQLGLDPLHALEMYCLMEPAAKISCGNEDGLYYGIDRIISDMRLMNAAETYVVEPDIIAIHWVVDCYATAREQMNMSYADIVRKWPAREVFKRFSPLHETSEANALEKMQFEQVDAELLVLNGKPYLRRSDVPEELTYLLEQRKNATPIIGILNCSTVFFHKEYEENGYLSNWYKSNFELEGHVFFCVEQWMMWNKAMMFGDNDVADKILQSKNPAEIKDLGRSVGGYIDSKWAAHRYGIVHAGVRAKFEQNKWLQEKLFSTNGYFAEAAVHDRIWGIGMDGKDPRRFCCGLWNGRNLLGAVLGDVYNELMPIEKRFYRQDE